MQLGVEVAHNTFADGVNTKVADMLHLLALPPASTELSPASGHTNWKDVK